MKMYGDMKAEMDAILISVLYEGEWPDHWLSYPSSELQEIMRKCFRFFKSLLIFGARSDYLLLSILFLGL
jgi:hypothetical protein